MKIIVKKIFEYLLANYLIMLYSSLSCFVFSNLSRVGIDIPTIEVRFEHLNVEAEAYVGSRAMPTFLNFAINLVEVNLSIF